MRIKIPHLTFLFFLFCLSACSTVQPWEKQHLAESEMQWSPDVLETSIREHTFFSKEASSGGNSAAGGGCGCN